MPKIIEEKFRDILKVEFKDMLEKFVDDREVFHAYSIGRVCTQGTLLGFDYHYYTVGKSPHLVGKYLMLGKFGEVHFHIDTQTNYGYLAYDNSPDIINSFLANYSTESSLKRPMP